MTQQQRRFLSGPLFPLSLMAAVFLLSLIFFSVFKPSISGRVFFFPTNSGDSIGSERRGVPARRAISEDVEVFLEELFLGPTTLEWAKAAPKGTEVRHVALIDKTAYVDLSRNMVETDSELPIGIETAISILEHNILFNFNKIEDVVFTIEGAQVHAPHFAPVELTE